MIHAWAICVYLGAKRRYINTLPFLSFPFLSFPQNVFLSSNFAIALGIHRVKWQHSILWSQYDLYDAGQHGDGVLCEAKWWRFVALFEQRLELLQPNVLKDQYTTVCQSVVPIPLKNPLGGIPVWSGTSELLHYCRYSLEELVQKRTTPLSIGIRQRINKDCGPLFGIVGQLPQERNDEACGWLSRCGSLEFLRCFDRCWLAWQRRTSGGVKRFRLITQNCQNWTYQLMKSMLLIKQMSVRGYKRATVQFIKLLHVYAIPGELGHIWHLSYWYHMLWPAKI